MVHHAQQYVIRHVKKIAVVFVITCVETNVYLVATQVAFRAVKKVAILHATAIASENVLAVLKVNRLSQLHIV